MAIEASNLTQKDELISKFYTVRAGLSVIAGESAKIKIAKSKFELAKLKDSDHDQAMMKKYDNDYKYFNNSLDDLQMKVFRANKKVLEKENELMEAKNNEKEITKKSARKYYNGEAKSSIISLSVFFGILTFVLLIVWMVCGFDVDTSTVLKILWPFLSIAISIFVGIVIFNAFAFKWGSENKYKKTGEALENIKRAEKECVIAKKEVKDAERVYNNYLSRKPKRESYSFYLYRQEVVDAENEMNATISASVATSKAAKEALLEYTEGLLIEDDWENIDLLIFYLKTGRADSLQDALLLVDKQRQTEQITQAIATATKFIGSSLERVSVRVDKLSENLSSEFYKLSENIERSNSYLMGAMAGVGSQIRNLNADISSQNQALLNAQMLNNALLERSNTQSDALMNELRYNQKYWVR